MKDIQVTNPYLKYFSLNVICDMNFFHIQNFACQD